MGKEHQVATSTAPAVDIGELLDKQKLSAFHLGTFLLCALIIIVDAADTGSANVAALAILPAKGRIGGTTGPLGSAMSSRRRRRSIPCSMPSRRPIFS